MGFAASITVTILFLAFMVLASITYPAIFHSISSVRNSIEDKHELQMDELNTRISILSAVDGGPSITVTVSNNGSTVLNASKSNVLVNGNYTGYSVSPDLWLPAKNAVFTVDASSYSRIKIITENGISAYKE